MQTAAAVLKSSPSASTGHPMKTRASTSWDAAIIFPSPFFASFKSTSWVNKSPHVYPVIQSSGNTMIFAPRPAASFIFFMISSVLYATSATRISGVTAAVLINPCLMLLLFSFPQNFYFLFAYCKISFNSSTLYV